jgi:hypothetical protein
MRQEDLKYVPQFDDLNGASESRLGSMMVVPVCHISTVLS